MSDAAQSDFQALAYPWSSSMDQRPDKLLTILEKIQQSNPKREIWAPLYVHAFGLLTKELILFIKAETVNI